MITHRGCYGNDIFLKDFFFGTKDEFNGNVFNGNVLNEVSSPM